MVFGLRLCNLFKVDCDAVQFSCPMRARRRVERVAAAEDCRFWIRQQRFDFMAVGLVEIAGLDRFPVIGLERFGDDGRRDGLAHVGADSGNK